MLCCPENWSIRSLGSLLQESAVPGSDGFVAKKFTLRLHGRGACAKQERRPGSPKTKYYRRFAGQLVYSKLDFLNGAMAILPPELDGRESTKDMPAFDLSPELDPDWLIAYLGRTSFYRGCAGLARGSRRALRMRSREFLAIKVALPPLQEQVRIAKVLARFDSARAAAQAVLEQTRQLQARWMTRVVSSAALAKPGRMVCLQEVAPPSRQSVVTGPYGALLARCDFRDAGVGVLKIGNLKGGEIDLERLAYVSPARASELQRYRLDVGDLLFARQGATTGKVAVVDERCRGFVFSYHLIRIAVDPAQCLAAYLAVYFQSQSFLDQLAVKKIKGTREGVNSKDLRSIRFPLPPLQQQAQIGAKAQRFAAVLAEQSKAIQELDRLKARVAEDLMSGRVRTVKQGSALPGKLIASE